MNEKPIRSCGSLSDHGPHETRNSLCYGNDPCLCADSVRSAIGSCPEEGHREYGSCPKRRYSDEYIKSITERRRNEEEQ